MLPSDTGILAGSVEASRVLRDNWPSSVNPLFPSWLEVDLDAVESNVQKLRRIIGPACRLAAVVKAQAYGLGAEEIARSAIRGGASQLCVARAQEGAALRRSGITAPILVLSAILPSELEACCAHELTPTVVDPRMIGALDRLAAGLGRTVNVHVKVDTGLTRYGAHVGLAREIARELLTSQRIVAEGLYTHFASSDEPDLGFTRQQIQRFEQIRNDMESLGITFRIAHAANSAGAIRVPEGRFDMVRTGITVSGYAPSSEVPVDVLQPCATLKGVLSRVYDLEPGVTIGYGRTFVVQEPTRAGLVPLGYADGIPRAMSDRGAMLVGGKRAPIIGRVSMDQCVINLSEIPQAQVGDEVVALGVQAGSEITLDELAAQSDTIPHEALCRLGTRLPRVYIRSGRVSRVVCFEGCDPA